MIEDGRYIALLEKFGLEDVLGLTGAVIEEPLNP